jgi:hypothetical protein
LLIGVSSDERADAGALTRDAPADAGGLSSYERADAGALTRDEPADAGGLSSDECADAGALSDASMHSSIGDMDGGESMNSSNNCTNCKTANGRCSCD